MLSLLLVDDERTILDGLYYNVSWEDVGFTEVFRADNADDALTCLRRQRIDVILSDIAMPGLDGIEMCREALKLWPLAKVIFLSGYRSFEYAQRAMALGAFEYLVKPVPYPELLAAAARALAAIRETIGREAPHATEQSLDMLRRERLLTGWLLFGETVDLTKDAFPWNPDSACLLIAVRTDGAASSGLRDSAGSVLFSEDDDVGLFTLPCRPDAFLLTAFLPSMEQAAGRAEPDKPYCGSAKRGGMS
ncbi:MAG TPA: response regulator [Clostridia bacterium]|nr:response regulator [Clostridia bacterium]